MGLKRKIFNYIDAFSKKVDKRKFGTESQTFIAMFHDIVKEEDFDQFAFNETKFIELIIEWQLSGFDIITIDSLFKNFNPNKNIVLTFDDGFASTYYIAKKFLIPNKIPFTVFVTTSFIGKNKYMTNSQIKELFAEPLCTIGLHSDMHLAFRYEKKETIIADFKICKQKLNSLLNCKTDYYYAFPYGSVLSVSRSNCRIIKKLGAKGVFMARQRKITFKDIRKAVYIPRLNIPGIYKK